MALVLGALGVVYGDIGTSPLYAVRASVLAASSGDMPWLFAVLGVLSLIFWSLALVVTGKYISIIIRADNKGEGGSLAFAALAHRSPGLPRRMKTIITVAGGIGLALFFGEALLTPAISVLSAVEGLSLEEPALAPVVLPLTLIILVGLFALQSRGTAGVGRLFGPIMAVWFVTLAVFGVRSILLTPGILWALNPFYGLYLFVSEPSIAFITLGSVVLCVTGVESLYADMGHFGAKPIRRAWLMFALPSLMLNYLGQGAVLLRDPASIVHPFYALAPPSLHYPFVLLATLATIVASQAVISGVFSITRQAVQLGQLPRMEVRHTSATYYGQVFLPRANMLMMIGVIIIVLLFKNANAVAGAYGVAVTGIMVISTFLVAIVARQQWGWGKWRMIGVFGPLALIDLSFFFSTMLKIPGGGWFPIMVAVIMLLIMHTWRSGRRVLTDKTYGSGLSTDVFLERADKTPLRVAGPAVFITPRLDEVPGALLHNLKHNQVLHERVIFLRVDVRDVPFVPVEKRLTVKKLGKGFFTIEAHFGFFQAPDVPRALEGARAHGLALDLDTITFFVRRENLVRARRSAMANWRTRLFIRLYSAALDAVQFYRLPPGRVIELGSQTEI